ncbi:MAG: ribosome small subunit-dependent GTPase A [Myxococcales bacterium]|nr:ribosome small subunit-dependent GTPase A [Myxococcales bacterium]
MSETCAPPGWDEAWSAARRAADPQALFLPVRISAAHRGAYHATSGADTAMVELRGRHYRAALDKRALPAVGDFCLVSGWDGAVAGAGSALIEHILPRRSLLVRRAAGTATAPQPLAANVDVALIVTSANSDLSAQRLDRYLELVRDGGIAPVVVISKIDLAADAEALLAEVAKLMPGVPVVATSAPAGLGLELVRAKVAPGRTAILLGSSGVGKSSLLSALTGGGQRTAPIRAHDERGRHTTTVRQLFSGEDGALWIDTPGMRELAAFNEGDVAVAFADVTELAARCRFADCQHRREPACAVAAAVAAGELSAARLASFHKLSQERARDRERADAAAWAAPEPPPARPAGRPFGGPSARSATSAAPRTATGKPSPGRPASRPGTRQPSRKRPG